MSLIETINIQNLNRVIENYTELISRFDVSVSTDHTEQYYRNLLPILTRYLSKINKINEKLGLVKIDYIASKKSNKNKKGRVYANASEGLIAFPREIRNYLLLDEHDNPLVVDLDIENCHPVIYYQFLVKDGFSKERLSNFYDYITNRNEWLFKYGKNIKQEIISVINCCQKLSSKTTDEGKEYENLIREIWDSQDWLQNKYGLSTLTKLKQFIFDKNTEIERQIIDIAMDYSREYFWDENKEDPCCIYAYDGFAIRNTPKVKKNKEDFLKRLNSLVYEKVGYFCKFTEKPIFVNPEIKEFLEKPKSSNGTTKKVKVGSYPIIDLTNIPGQFLGDRIRENLVSDFKEDIIVLDISMAGGKSYKTYSDFNDIRNSGGKINTISILNRISLIDNIKHDYPFIYSYREDSESRIIHGINKSVVCCSESLYRLTDRTRIECDVLFLDEIESVLPQMVCGETHGINMKVNQENFLGLLISSRKIIISDANIQEDTINFIKEIREKFRNEKSQVLKFVDTPRKKRDVLFVENNLDRMIKALSSGKRLFVPCTRSIKFGEGIIRTLQSQFPEKKILYIHSENKGQYSNLLSDTQLWVEYDVIMISPCISSGVSCVIKNHFDEVYCFFSSSSSNPYDSVQMIGRVRYPTTENIYIEFDDKTNNNYKFGYRTREEVLKMLHLNIKDLYGSHNGYIDNTFDYITTKRTLLKSPRTELFCFNYSTQSKLYTQYRYHLKKALENSYICTISHKSLTDEEEPRELTSTKQKEYEYQNERSLAIFNSKNLTSQEIDDIQLKHKVGSHLTIVEEHQQNKYFLSVKSKMPLHSIDKFVSDNEKRQPRVLFRVLNSKLENVVKPLGFFINHLSGSSETNSLSLGRLFNPIQFELRDFKNSEVITTKWLGENINGTMLRFVWVEKILKLFGARHIFDAISLTPEEFIERYKKFLEWTRVLCVPLIDGKTNFDRLVNLFSLRVDHESIYSQKQLRKIPENKGYQLINCLLRPIGLSFKTEYIRKREDKKIVNHKIYKLSLNYPILLNYYMNPEPISYMSNSKEFLKLSKDTLPILTTGNIPKMSEEWIELYKASVFYSLPKVRTDKEEDEGGDKITKSEN